MSERRDNSGALFKNEEKKSDKHPDYSGSAVVGGIDYRIAGWIKVRRESGGKYLSLAFTPKDEQRAKPEDDDIPFAWLLVVGLGAWATLLAGAVA